MHVWCYASLVRWFFGAMHLLSIIFWWDTSFVWWIFRMDVVRFYSKAMYRQIGEGCLIQCSEAELLMNGKLDHFAPVVGGWWSPQQCRVAGGESGILAEPELFSARLLTQFDTHTKSFVFAVQRIFCWKFSASLHHFVLSWFITFLCIIAIVLMIASLHYLWKPQNPLSLFSFGHCQMLFDILSVRPGPRQGGHRVNIIDHWSISDHFA